MSFGRSGSPEIEMLCSDVRKARISAPIGVVLSRNLSGGAGNSDPLTIVTPDGWPWTDIADGKSTIDGRSFSSVSVMRIGSGS